MESTSFAFMGSTKSRGRAGVAGCGFTSWNLEAQYDPIGNAIADEIKKQHWNMSDVGPNPAGCEQLPTAHLRMTGVTQ
jgi:hypothetical protein